MMSGRSRAVARRDCPQPSWLPEASPLPAVSAFGFVGGCRSSHAPADGTARVSPDLVFSCCFLTSHRRRFSHPPLAQYRWGVGDWNLSMFFNKGENRIVEQPEGSVVEHVLLSPLCPP